MSEFDLANCIRLFKLEENQSPEKPSFDYYAVIPVEEQNVFQPINSLENDREEFGYIEDWSYTFSEEGIDLLVEFRTELEDLFSDCGNIFGIGAVLWKEISCRLFESGINVSGKQCFDKWNSLYSEYLQTAMSDDEGKISNFRNFEKFEGIYKIRSSRLKPRIESGNSGSTDEIFNIVESKDSVESHKDGKKEKDFTLESEFTEISEENCQTSDYRVLREMITTAENLLDEDIRKEEDSKEEVKLDAVKTQKPRCANKRKLQRKIPAEIYCSRGKCKDKTNVKGTDEPRCAPAKDSRQNDVDESFEKVEFCWDADSTQCLIDLRLHVELNSEVKKSIVASYKSIAKFLSEKMRSNGWEISEDDCKQKWAKLIRCYYKEAKNCRAKAVRNNEEVSVSQYFYEIDKVMKKSGRLRSANFTWCEESVRMLIGIRIKTESAFSMFKKYIILWQYVATQMAKKNFFPTYNECSMKWIELREYYDFCFNVVKIGLLKKEEIGWEFFLDMYHAFEQRAKISECVIEYPKVEYPATESESFGTIKENVPVRSSIVPASVDVFETLTGKKLETLHGKECLEDGKARTESVKYWLGGTEDTEIQSTMILDIIEAKTLPFKSDERFIQTYNFYNASASNGEEKFSCPKYLVESEAPKLLSSEKIVETTRADKSNANDSLEVKSKCVWDKLMITILIELKFSEEIRDLKNYGQPIAIRMHAAGYRDVTPSDCTKKWMSLRKSYDRCLVRKITGKSITWQYFDLMNKHVENLVSEIELRIKNGHSSLVCLPDCVRDLFQHKLSHPEVFGETEPTNESHDSKDGNIPTGNDIEEIGEQPINFSRAEGKRKVDEEFGGGKVVEKLSTNTKHVQQGTRVSRAALDKNVEFGDEIAAIDLSTKVLGPCSEQNFAQNIAASDNSKAWRFDNYVDGAKENVRFFLDENTKEPLSEKNFKRREGARSKIWCDEKPCNEIYSAEKAGNNQAGAYELKESQSLDRFRYDLPIQDGSVNSRQSCMIAKKGEWNNEAMNLLADLRIEHERKFSSGYSERSENLWEKIADQMTTMGYNFTSEECWQKWCLSKGIYEDKMANIKENRLVQAWPYFGKFDSIYKEIGKMYKGFKRLSPEKRKRDDDDEEDGNKLREPNLSSPKKLVISMLPSNSCCSGVSIPNAKNDALEKNGACNYLKKTITWY